MILKAPTLYVAVQEENFSVSREHKRLQEIASDKQNVGAVVTFTGAVREISQQKKLSAMTLEHYPGMTEKQLLDICQRAKQRWDLSSASIVHRIGTLLPNENIVFVGASSPHRADSFAANQFMMDILKTSATFWKKEHFGEDHVWVNAKTSDTESANRWR